MSGRLVIIGSGETAPTMIKIHRGLIGDPAVMLDTPYGFQVNADDLTDKIREYFAESVGARVEAGRWRRRDEAVSDRERTLALIQRASWVFAGPGSPSYALRQWQETAVPMALREVIERGGSVTLGSAAAVTLGSHAIPVYEIYKVGLDPYWERGLDLLGAVTGISAAVVPHYDNREGGRHDTRYCYLGEERLTRLEAELPEDTGVLGVDEHTAVVIDVVAGVASVQGAGGLTLRRRGTSEVVPSGSSISVADIRDILAGRGAGREVQQAQPAGAVPAAPAASGPPSLREIARGLRANFDAGLADRNADGALAACLDLEQAIHEWSRDTLEGDTLDVARGVLRGMVVDLAGTAVAGLRDERAVVGPVVEAALAARAAARAARDFAMSDLIRDRLAEAGVEVRDTPEGQAWDLLP